MPIKEDFIERMLRQFVEMLAAVFKKEKAGDLDGALDEIERGYALLLGEQRALLDFVDTATLAGLFGPAYRLRGLARLCVTEARILRTRGEAGRARQRAQQALDLYGLAGTGDADDEAALEAARSYL